jgi:dolichyl-phosphate-mannose-protein mannosyltransferase
MSPAGRQSNWNSELLGLTIAAFATRCWRIGQSNAAVFDEVFSDTFAGHYLTGAWYYDVHPPLARLLTAAVARLAGMSGADLLAGKSEVALRIVPALLGALLVPLGYVLLRELVSSRRVAGLGALFVLEDNALLVESRLDLPEPFLLFFEISALTAFVASRLRSR